MDLEQITRLTPLDLLDVLIISYVILRFLRLFRGTTTLQILIGLGFLRVMLIVARASNLVMTSWLLEGINAIAVLVIVVVFRNEIREVLLQSNPARLFFGRPEKARAVDLPAVAEAAFRLAATRTGALLVFPNRDKLGEHVREGVALGGRFSGAVLESFFAKTSPVHDGAAVIRGGRIDRVGALLPLSTRSGLPPEFGTRHRAAVGLSEVCDAVVVVVSEERGEVSIAQSGLVEPVEDARTLERLLRHRLLGQVEGKNSNGWTAELLRQAGGHLAVFVLVSASVVIWRAYFGEQVSVKNLNVPISFRNVPAGLELQSTTSNEVAVQVCGQGPLFNALSQDQVIAYVDLTDVQPGRHIIHLSAENVTLPPGLVVDRLTPPSLELTIERRARKSVRVEPELIGEPPGNIRVSVEPTTVLVSGPESVLNGLDRLRTEPIDLQNLNAAHPGKVVPQAAVVLSPPSLRLLSPRTNQVRVVVELVKPGDVDSP